VQGPQPPPCTPGLRRRLLAAHASSLNYGPWSSRHAVLMDGPPLRSFVCGCAGCCAGSVQGVRFVRCTPCTRHLTCGDGHPGGSAVQGVQGRAAIFAVHIRGDCIPGYTTWFLIYADFSFYPAHPAHPAHGTSDLRRSCAGSPFQTLHRTLHTLHSRMRTVFRWAASRREWLGGGHSRLEGVTWTNGAGCRCAGRRGAVTGRVGAAPSRASGAGSGCAPVPETASAPGYVT